MARETRKKTSIAIVDVKSKSERVILNDSDVFVNALAISPDGRWLAASADKTVRIWETHGWKQTDDLIAADEDVLSVAFSENSRCVAFGAADGRVKIYDVSRKAISSTFDTPALKARCVTFSNDGTKLAAAVGKSVWLWDVASGHPLKTLPADRRRVTSVLFTPDGESILTIGTDKAIKVWKVN